MSDVLKMVNELRDRLFASYGNPLATYKKTQHDIHMSYYVGKLMEEQGHDVLFYENTDGGHAAAADHKQSAEMWGLSFVYLAQKLGLKN